MWDTQTLVEWYGFETYREVTKFLSSQMTWDQVQGFTWFWFQSLSWLGNARNDILNANNASPENGKNAKRVKESKHTYFNSFKERRQVERKWESPWASGETNDNKQAKTNTVKVKAIFCKLNILSHGLGLFHLQEMFNKRSQNKF